MIIDHTALFDQYPDGYYLFSEAQLLHNLEALRAAFRPVFADVTVAYSYKTNYTPTICRTLHEHGVLAEVVSDMELQLAVRLGVTGAKIIFNGPFKSPDSLRRAMLHGACIHIDSLDELQNLRAIRQTMGEHPNVRLGVRINFPMADERRSRFGMDVDGEEYKEALRLIDQEGYSLEGLHCHHPHREAHTFKDRMLGLLDAYDRLGLPVSYLDIGGGFASPMSEALARTLGIQPHTYRDYAEHIGAAIEESPVRGRIPSLIIEPGSALVANTMHFLSRVVSIKEIGTKRIATLSGSKFNILPNAKRPINLPLRVFSRTSREAPAHPVTYDLCGYTCIETDVLYEGYQGDLQREDIVMFSNVGSYSVVMKPPFILPNYPVLTHHDNGTIAEIKYGETFDTIFGTFPDLA